MKTLLMLSLVTVLSLLVVPNASAVDSVVDFDLDAISGTYTITKVKTVTGTNVTTKTTAPTILGTTVSGGYYIPKYSGSRDVYLTSKVYSLAGILLYTVRTGNHWEWRYPKVLTTSWYLPRLSVYNTFGSSFTMSYVKGPAFWITYLNSPYGCRYKSMKIVVKQSLPYIGTIATRSFFHEYWLRGDGTYKWRITW